MPQNNQRRFNKHSVSSTTTDIIFLHLDVTIQIKEDFGYMIS